jgi:hypothetical protein
MRTKHKVRNLREEQAQGPDCCTCAERKTCEKFAENSFCTRWHSNDPEKEGTDPNKAWARGDDTPWN